MRQHTYNAVLLRAGLLLVLFSTVWSQAHGLVVTGNEEAAKAHFRAAQGEYTQGRFAEALVAFGMAYRAWSHPAFLFNIGQCHRQLGDHAAAIFYFQAYLDGIPQAPNAEAVDQLIGESLAALREAGEDADYDVPPEFASLILGRDLGDSEATGAASDSPYTAPGGAVTPLPGEEPRDTPLYTKWWFWTAVALVVAGAAVGLGMAGREDPVTDNSLSPMDLR